MQPKSDVKFSPTTAATKNGSRTTDLGGDQIVGALVRQGLQRESLPAGKIRSINRGR